MAAVFTLKAGYIVFLRPFLYYSPYPVSTERLQVKWCNDFMSTQSTENGRSSDLKLPPKHDGAATHQVHTHTVEALDVIDRAPFWFRVRIWLVAFSGFFIDAYDIFAINLASVMLGYVYGRPTVSSNQVFETRISTN